MEGAADTAEDKSSLAGRVGAMAGCSVLQWEEGGRKNAIRAAGLRYPCSRRHTRDRLSRFIALCRHFHTICFGARSAQRSYKIPVPADGVRGLHLNRNGLQHFSTPRTTAQRVRPCVPARFARLACNDATRETNTIREQDTPKRRSRRRWISFADILMAPGPHSAPANDQ